MLSTLIFLAARNSNTTSRLERDVSRLERDVSWLERDVSRLEVTPPLALYTTPVRRSPALIQGAYEILLLFQRFENVYFRLLATPFGVRVRTSDLMLGLSPDSRKIIWTQLA